MKTPEQLNCLRLARSENIGKSTFFRLLKIFGSAHAALEQLPEFAASGGLKRKIKIFSGAEAELEIENTKKFGAEILIFSDQNYPQLLRQISDPAPILTIKGNAEFFNRDTIAVVGPRNASFGAMGFAKKIAGELGENSIVAVSGLARGIDAAAHHGSLNSGTIAVIAGGIDHIYPQENEKLFAEIIAQGLLVSENPFGSPPKGGNFVQRNRIISGLSLGVVVVEAGLKSGSLTTARFAKEQGREIFAVPGSPFDTRCLGTNRLIKDGAKMFENIDDVLTELPRLKAKFRKTQMLCEPEAAMFEGPSQKMPSEKEIEKIRQEIFTKLSSFPTAIEEIIFELQAPARLVNIALVQLELAEKIEVNFGKVTRKISCL
ncbi:MAG: DNA-processing protein DprA [Rickettsiales bacterium]|nr:DNA-processing protein DprA [Rickettsiales bacterium]